MSHAERPPPYKGARMKLLLGAIACAILGYLIALGVLVLTFMGVMK